MADGSDTSVLDEVYSTGNDVNDTVNQVNQYAQSNSDSSSGGDPLEQLIENGLDFLLDLIEPAKEALNMVTGDPDALNSAASTYQNLSKEIDQLGQQIHDEIKQGVTSWKGDASDTAQKQCEQLLDGIHGTATLAGYIGQVCTASAGMMKTAHEVIIGIIASFVEQMIITWVIDAVTSAITLGISNAAAMAASVTEAGIACARAGEAVSKVAQLIEKVGSMIEKISQLIEKISGIIEKISGAVEKFAGSGSKVGKALESLSGKGGLLGKVAGDTKDTVSDIGTASKDVGSTGSHLGDLGRALKTGDSQGAADAAANVVGDGRNVITDGKNLYHDGKSLYDDGKEVVDKVTGNNDDNGDNSGGDDGDRSEDRAPNDYGAGNHAPDGHATAAHIRSTFGPAAKDAIKTAVHDNVTQPLEDAAKTDGKQILSDTWNNGSPDPQAGLNDLDNLVTFGTLDPPQPPDQSSDQIDQELSADNPSGQGN
jgi:WXG100 family type VII secretion target